MAELTLIGYRPSVYTRAVRIALHELGRAHAWIEADPFDPDGRAALAAHHPFGRVPVLRHGAVTIYETRAILCYLAAAFRPGGARDALRVAREAQVQGIVDAYGYWPMVRQVYSHGAYRPAMGEAHDPRLVAEGLAASEPVLDALDGIAREGRVLTGQETGPADWHLAPMIDAFRQVPAGAALLAGRAALASWFDAVSARESLSATVWRPAGAAA